MRKQPSRYGGGTHGEWEEVLEVVSLICSLGLCKRPKALPVTLGSQHSNIRPCLLVGWVWRFFMIFSPLSYLLILVSLNVVFCQHKLQAERMLSGCQK